MHATTSEEVGKNTLHMQEEVVDSFHCEKNNDTTQPPSHTHTRVRARTHTHTVTQTERQIDRQTDTHTESATLT